MKKKCLAFLAAWCVFLFSFALAPLPAAAADYLHDLSAWYNVAYTQGSAVYGGESCTWIVKTVTDTAAHTVYFYCDFTETSYAPGRADYDISLELRNENTAYAPVFVRSAPKTDAFSVESNFSDSAAYGGAVCTFSLCLQNSRDYNVPNSITLVLYVNQHPYTVYTADSLVFSGQAQAQASSSSAPASAAEPDEPAQTDAPDNAGEQPRTQASSTKFHADIELSSAQTGTTKFSGSAAVSPRETAGVVSSGALTDRAADTAAGEAAATAAAGISALPSGAKAGIGIAVVLLVCGAVFVLKGLFMRSSSKENGRPDETDASVPAAPEDTPPDAGTSPKP